MKDERLLKGEPIASGIVEGEILVSKDPINFYMVSPEKGTIIEQDHALTDKVIAKKIIVFPIDKGSSVVQMDGLYQMSKFDNKPAGFIVLDLSTVLVSNAIIMDIPLIRVDQQTYDKFCEGQKVKMDGDSGEKGENRYETQSNHNADNPDRLYGGRACCGSLCIPQGKRL